MSFRPRKRITRRSTARALDRSGSSGVPEVDEILAAATAPPTGFELNREADTVAMFRSANPRSGSTARVTIIQTVRRRVAAAKVAVLATAVALVAGGGVAFAASTGNLPEVFGGDPRPNTGAAPAPVTPGQPGSGQPGSGQPGTELPGTQGPADPDASVSVAGPTATPSAIPSPSFRGLCRAFQAQAAANPGKAEGSPKFTALATEAGGKEHIAEYCVSLIGDPKPRPTKDPQNDDRGSKGDDQGASPGEESSNDGGSPSGGTTPGKPESPGKPENPGKPESPGKPTKTDKPKKPLPTQANPNAVSD